MPYDFKLLWDLGIDGYLFCQLMKTWQRKLWAFSPEKFIRQQDK